MEKKRKIKEKEKEKISIRKKIKKENRCVKDHISIFLKLVISRLNMRIC
jgi:hypothetical protein